MSKVGEPDRAVAGVQPPVELGEAVRLRPGRAARPRPASASTRLVERALPVERRPPATGEAHPTDVPSTTRSLRRDRRDPANCSAVCRSAVCPTRAFRSPRVQFARSSRGCAFGTVDRGGAHNSAWPTSGSAPRRTRRISPPPRTAPRRPPAATGAWPQLPASRLTRRLRGRCRVDHRRFDHRYQRFRHSFTTSPLPPTSPPASTSVSNRS